MKRIRTLVLAFPSAFEAVMWIRIRSDRHHFDGSQAGPADPEPDPYSFLPSVKLNYTFFQKFQYTVKILKINTLMGYDADEKDK